VGERGELDVWWRVGVATVGRIYRTAIHVRYRGLEHIPRLGPAIVGVNHVSVLDPVAIALGTASQGRMLRFLAATEFFAHPVWGPGLRVMRQIPIRRGIRDLAALDELTSVLRGGGLAGIFPEGRVGDGSLPLRGRSGATRVALATGAPILPVAVWGTQARWPRGPIRYSRPLRTPVAVAFGEPYALDPAIAGSPGEMRRATRDLMVRIEGLIKVSQRAVESWTANRRGHAPLAGPPSPGSGRSRISTPGIPDGTAT
jgi:1-acyl-sn-glycerol-3-phosphate acyltransferase